MMTQEERVRAKDKYRAHKLDLMLSIGVSNLRDMAEIMFDLGCAYGLREAADIMKEPG